MTPEERRTLIHTLDRIVEGVRLMLDANLKQLRRNQSIGARCDPLVASLSLVDRALCDAEQGLKTIAKWEAK